MVTKHINTSVHRYEKVVFEWNEPRPLVTVPRRLRFRSVTPDTRDQFVRTIEHTLEGSLDRFDQVRAARYRASLIAELYACPNERDFRFELDWWQLAFARDGEVVGFTQPVVFRDGARGALEEGTIHYIGVVPKHRGKGYILDLLAAVTHKLQKIGVWRIYCDTDVQNTPMVTALRRIGYLEGETHVVTYPLNRGDLS